MWDIECDAMWRDEAALRKIYILESGEYKQTFGSYILSVYTFVSWQFDSWKEYYNIMMISITQTIIVANIFSTMHAHALI